MKEKFYPRKKKSICKQDFRDINFNMQCLYVIFLFCVGWGEGLNIAKNIHVLILPSSYPKQVLIVITEKCYPDFCGICYYYNFVK